MKDAATRLSIACCLTMLLIVPMGSLSSVRTAFALNPANAIWVEPPIVNLANVSIGYKFNVTMWVNLNDTSFGWQVGLRFNPTFLQVARVAYTGPGHSQFFQGHTTISVQPIINNVTGNVMLGETLLNPDSREPGSGSLCWMEFQVMAKGVGSDKLNINNADTFVFDPNIRDLPITKYDAQIVWAPPRLLGTVLFFNITPNPAIHGQTIVLRGLLADEDWKLLPNQTVKLYARPLVGSWLYIASVVTNASGVFVWQAAIPNEVVGTYVFAAYYPGSATYIATYNFAVLVIQ